MSQRFEQYRPAVRRKWLLLLNGAMWIGVGAMLDSLAYGWLSAPGTVGAPLLAASGLAGALFIAHFGFLRVVDKNLGRIAMMDGKRCLFSFMSWKSYLIMLVMMAGGFGLRYSPIPKPYLAVVYIGIGTALMLSSLRYFKRLLAWAGTE